MTEQMTDSAPLRWWERRSFALLLILLAGAPLWWPEIPPLTDLLGHMGRYRIQLGIGDSAFFQHYYDFNWALIGNLGVDLLVQALGPLIGLEPAVKLIAIAIPMLATAGMLFIAREAHGRLPATAAFALPLGMGYPVLYGFVNFALSMGLALIAFGLWLRMDRLGQIGWRALIFVPLGCAIWVAHVYGWGVLGLLVFAHEWHKAGWRRIIPAGLRCLPLVPPMLLMLLWRGDGAGGDTFDWFNLEAKLYYFTSALRDHWKWFDAVSIIILIGIAYTAFRHPRTRMQPTLGLAALLLLIIFVLLPRVLMGSAYADMRLAPYMLAIGVLAYSTQNISPRVQAKLAVAALAFFLIRNSAMGAHFISLDRNYRIQLAALDHLPEHSRVFSLVNVGCFNIWSTKRMDHLPSMATVRRNSFVNDQWVLPGAQLLRVTYPQAGIWGKDPSQIIRPLHCKFIDQPIYEHSLVHFPRHAYDYLWLVDFPPERWPKRDKSLQLIWRGKKTGALYRVVSGDVSEKPDESQP